MSEWMVNETAYSQSELVASSAFFCPATLPSAGLKTRTREGLTGCGCPLALVNDLYTDWGEPPVSCRARSLPGQPSQENIALAPALG